MKTLDRCQWDGKILPRFCLVDDYLFCDHRYIDLGRRPLTKKLISAFLDNDSAFITRDQLAEHVYGAFELSSRTPRFRDALRQNVTKMVSRARSLCESQLNEHENSRLEMFVHIPEKGGWAFYRLTNAYLAGIEQRLTQWPSAHFDATVRKRGEVFPQDRLMIKTNQSLAA